ncbi:MAG: response regulator transcription factor [Sulfurimonas sp.]|nr:response regulator transcription factor [Sulfurimonas sp.]
MRKYLKNYTLLYCEDDDNIRKSMQEYFNAYFKEVYIATDGNNALDIYQKYSPHVVILDINMPKKNGLDIARIIRKKDTITRIVILTAYSDQELLLQATEINMSKYLIKPVSPTLFKETLDKVAKELLFSTHKMIQLDKNTLFISSSQQLISYGQEITLSEKEKKLLALLSANINKPVSFEEIMIHVWHEHLNSEISKESVKSQISYLRSKLPKNIIHNVYGFGYCLKIQ